MTDRKRQKILADYVETQNFSETGRMNGVSKTTVRNIVKGDTKISEKLQQKKEENTADMISYMDTRRAKAQSAMDSCLEAMADPARIANATLSQVGTVFGILCDKFLAHTDTAEDRAQVIIANMQTMVDILRTPQPDRDISDYESKEEIKHD
jgi:hypothetical protein